MDISILKRLGFSDRMATIYLTLLRLGPSSVRKLAEFSGFNRGVVYEDLKWLQIHEVVEFFEKESRQFFVAKDPEKLVRLVKEKADELEETDKQLKGLLPELYSLYDKGGGEPVARYYEKKEVAGILEDVLKVCEEAGEFEYRIYSAQGIREYIYDGFPTFSDVRVAKGIAVKAIAMGKGGELRGLDERKWLEVKESAPTYIIIYPGKTAYISLNAKGEPMGVVIENDGICKTQKQIFDSLWEKL